MNFAVDIPGHAPTFQSFGKIVSDGVIEKRRLTLTVEWGAVEKLAEQV